MVSLTIIFDEMCMRERLSLAESTRALCHGLSTNMANDDVCAIHLWVLNHHMQIDLVEENRS